MDIAFVSNVVYPFTKGGTEKRVYEIGTRLSKRGHKVTIYGRHWWDGPSEITLEGMKIHGVSPNRELFVNGRRSIAEALQFSKDILRPIQKRIDEHDIVVASVSGYFPVLASKLPTQFSGTPLITTWHEVWGQYWWEYLGYLAPFGWGVERLVAHAPQHPVAVSQTTANKLARIGPSRDEITVIPNGVDIEQITTVLPADDGFDILFVGRLIPEKNADLLLDAFDRIAGDYNVTLGIIGDGQELDTLRRKANTMTHSDSVTFLGFLENYEDVLAHMHASELFVLPSTREGFGITFLEAMAADCKIITVDHPNTTADEVVGDAGFVTEFSVPAVADAMRRSLDGETPPRDPVHKAKQYDWERISIQAEKLYESFS